MQKLTTLILGLAMLLLFTEITLAQQSVPKKLRVPEGFEAQLIYSVPKEQGSWVNLTTDPQGRLITSDQYGKLYRVTLNKETANSPSVEPITLKIGRAQGLLCAFDCLYVSAHAGNGLPAGLFRVPRYR